MLGIVIGVAAVVVMVAVGNGARERIATQIRSLGANLIGISPGSVKTGGVRMGRGARPRLSEDAFAGAVGVFFGLYPARRAARLDPMVALRTE